MKVLLYDIETMGERGWYFPPRYETNILHVDHFGHMMSIAWKWLGEKKVHVTGLDDYKLYKKDHHNDIELAKLGCKLFEEADVVIAHNGNNFDQKMVQYRMMVHHLRPPSPYQQIDTKTAVKRVARFPSNKLDDLGRELELGQKLSHGNFKEMWLAADEGDAKAWKIMKRYNKQDVVLLEQLYMHIRPWISNHPASNVLDGRPDSCKNCGSEKIHAGMKYRATNTNLYQYFRCMGCGANLKSRMPEPKLKEERMKYV